MPIAQFRAVVTVPLMGVRLCAGFPSPADDYVEDALDPTRLMVVNPAATFFWHVRGTSVVDAGIGDGDMLVVNRALAPQHMDVVVRGNAEDVAVFIFAGGHGCAGFLYV